MLNHFRRFVEIYKKTKAEDPYRVKYWWANLRYMFYVTFLAIVGALFIIKKLLIL